MIRRSTLIITLAAALVVGGWAVTAAHADSVSSSGLSIVEQIGCDITNASDPKNITVDNPCQIKDFVNLFIYLSKWGMSILGLLAVFMFVYGGFQFVTAGGRASKVDEGKRVMTGTVIGTIIALTAYVIINTAVAAISGSTIRVNSYNPFGPVAAVFTDQTPPLVIQGQTSPVKLKAPFSGKTGSGGAGNDIPDCRKPTSAWDRSCDGDQLQVYCADPGTSGGEIATLQKKLNDKRCGCGETDGCFGPITVACVRKFQIANLLPPSGVIDATTKGKISSDGRDCDASGSQADSVASLLPQTQLSTAPGDGVGCCIVKSGQNDLYCVDGVTTRACQALGADSERVSGACGVAAGTVGHCGFCSDVTTPISNAQCFQLASPYWCTNVAKISFNFGKCDSCRTCVKTVLGIPIAP
ncbi:MAG: peptidoglycan-binding protein [Patescibacteria group bacterium]